MAEEKQCVLVIVGADEYGRKELLAMTPSRQMATQSPAWQWTVCAKAAKAPSRGLRANPCRSTGRELLLDLKRRGLKQDPKLAIHCPAGDLQSKSAERGDGALGFWTALREVFATTREQRCWVHNTVNVLNTMPKSVQAKAKGHLHDIWQAETKAKANAAFDFLVETYGVKWDNAVAKLVKDRDALLIFYGFRAEH